MAKSSAKKIKVMDEKKGLVEIGKLSKNELCRGIQSLIQEGQKNNMRFHMLGNQYANHLASFDAMSPDERKEYWNVSK